MPVTLLQEQFSNKRTFMNNTVDEITDGWSSLQLFVSVLTSAFKNCSIHYVNIQTCCESISRDAWLIRWLWCYCTLYKIINWENDKFTFIFIGELRLRILAKRN